MSPKEINIAISEACPEVHRKLYGPAWTPETHGYHNDLNAMQEVIVSLTDDEMVDFAEWLGMDFDEHPTTIARCIRQPDRTWAEAFLRTKNLWRDK